MIYAINLSPANYWTPQPFIDRMKVCGEWTAQSTGPYVMVPLDSPGALFELLYDGDAKIKVPNIVSASPGRVVFRAPTDLSKPQIQVKAYGAQPTNVRIVRQDQLDMLAAGEVFQPEFLDDMQGFTAFRCMDWMETNNSTRVDILIEDVGETYSRGMPLSVIVALANRTGMRPWVNAPHLATDAAITAALSYLDAKLRPDIRAIVEFSNECGWNSIFSQTKYAAANSPKKGNGNYWYGLQCARLAKLARDHRVGVVVASQWVSIGGMKSVLAGIVDGGATDADFEAVAPAAYVGYPSGTSDLDMANAGSIEAVHRLIAGTLLGFRAIADQWVALAKAHGWKTWTYEGLQYHLNVNGTLGPDKKKMTKTQLVPLQVFAQSVQMDPASGPLLMTFIDALADAGFDMGTTYNYAQPPTIDGFFGMRSQPAWSLLKARMAPVATPEPLTLESLARRVAALERLAGATGW